MKVLDCENPSVQISLPPCAGDTAVVELQRANYTTVPLALTEDGYAFPDPFPANIPFPARGVWKLTAVTGCGCYETDVYVDCPAPQLVPLHTPTANAEVIVCCEPDDAIGFSIETLDPPVVEVDDYPDAELVVDGDTAALDLGDASVTGGYTLYDDDGIPITEGEFTAGVTEYHELTCTHYYLTRQP